MRVVDDFLSPDQHAAITEVVLGGDFPWYYNKSIVFDEDDDRYQFTHVVVREFDGERSWAYPLFEPILERLGNPKLFRAKLNLGPRDHQHSEGGFHVDCANMTTALFYVNTTNGFTRFADGSVVEGIANRLVEFDSNIPHTGVSHTDAHVRCVLNLNYERIAV
jgi:hypothetical protein